MDAKALANFIFELGHLKRIKHEGWRLIGVEHPESVAEHSLRAAQIAYVLAHMEKYEQPLLPCVMAVFHDIGECRVGDLHKVAARYVECREDLAVQEQVAPLGEIGGEIFSMWQQVEEKSSSAGVIAKDADYMEQAFVAKEYVERGMIKAQDWLNNVEKALRTESAKKLFQEMTKMHSADWWAGLKKLK